MFLKLGRAWIFVHQSAKPGTSKTCVLVRRERNVKGDRREIEVGEAQVARDERGRALRLHGEFDHLAAVFDAALAHRLVLAADEIRKQMISGDAARQGAIAVGIDQADDHVHPRAILGRRRDQRLAGQDIVEVARNRGRLQNAHAVMVEDRHLAEGMPLHVLGRFRVAREHIQRHLLEVGHAFFGQHHLDRADIS